jgi:hypothetical protein
MNSGDVSLVARNIYVSFEYRLKVVAPNRERVDSRQSKAASELGRAWALPTDEHSSQCWTAAGPFVARNDVLRL